jgi:hypothetical protein
MILFFNIIVTSDGISKYHRHDWLPVYDRVDIFKYCLASYSALKPVITKSIFYIELGTEFEDRKEELQSYIYELFPDCELYWHRNIAAFQWREICSKHFKETDLIWYSGNDDHIFIDHDLDLVKEAIDLIQNDADPLAVMYYSHWQEQCRLSHYMKGELTQSGNFVRFTYNNFDSIQLMKGIRFINYWEGSQLDGMLLRRSDALNGFYVNVNANFYAPTRELVRHYDGYSHLGANFTKEGTMSSYLSNIAPPLVIPDGFFEKNLKIRFGYTDRKPGWVTLNAKCGLYTAKPDGVDYRWLESDIPLFWRDLIQEIDYSPDYNADEQAYNRDSAFVVSTRLPMWMFGQYHGVDKPEDIPSIDWYKNHLKYEKNESTDPN